MPGLGLSLPGLGLLLPLAVGCSSATILLLWRAANRARCFARRRRTYHALPAPRSSRPAEEELTHIHPLRAVRDTTACLPREVGVGLLETESHIQLYRLPIPVPTVHTTMAAMAPGLTLPCLGLLGGGGLGNSPLAAVVVATALTEGQGRMGHGFKPQATDTQ